MDNNLRGIADLTESDGLPCEAKVLQDAADKIERLLGRLSAIRDAAPDPDESALRFAARLQRIAGR